MMQAKKLSAEELADLRKRLGAAQIDATQRSAVLIALASAALAALERERDQARAQAFRDAMAICEEEAERICDRHIDQIDEIIAVQMADTIRAALHARLSPPPSVEDETP